MADSCLSLVSRRSVQYEKDWLRSGEEPDLNSAEFEQWLSETKRIEPNEKAQEWFLKNKDRLQGIYTDDWARFQNKTQAEKPSEP